LDCASLWRTEELLAAQDPSFTALAIMRRAEVNDRAAAIAATLSHDYPGVFPPDRFTKALVRWALLTVSARAYGRRLNEPALVPMADAFNHGAVRVKYGVAATHADALAADAATAAAATAVGERGDGDDSDSDGGGRGKDDGSDTEEEDEEEEEESESDGGSTDSEADSDGAATGGGGDGEGAPGHAGHARRTARGEPHEGVFTLWSCDADPIRAGSEVLNSYGRRDNRHLLLEYGFALLDNEWEEVELKPNPGEAAFAALPVAAAFTRTAQSTFFALRLWPATVRLHARRWQGRHLPFWRALAATPEQVAAAVALPPSKRRRCALVCITGWCGVRGR
jgi:hypothetical protein